MAVIVRDPSMPATSLSCIHLASLRPPLQVFTLALRSCITAPIGKEQLLRLPDPSAHPAPNSSRHSHSFAQIISYKTQTRFRRHRNRSTLLSDRLEPNTGSLLPLFLPVGTAHTPLNTP